jgi:hypothetical protein
MALSEDQIKSWVILFSKGKTNKEIADQFKIAYGITSLTAIDRDKISKGEADFMIKNNFTDKEERRNLGKEKYGSKKQNEAGHNCSQCKNVIPKSGEFNLDCLKSKQVIAKVGKEKYSVYVDRNLANDCPLFEPDLSAKYN